jgi:enoyl-CoA hydratase
MRAEDLASDEIGIERRGAVALVTLNRPRALHALTHDMVRRLSRALALWRDDPEVGAVVVRAVPGRAFCAGGDIRAIVETVRQSGIEHAVRFFFDEYRLNWRIRQFPKPYVALIDGITMGGGVGVSVHGSHRIVTENTVFAMPETAIGFFPDVGGSSFLPRLPDRVGFHLGLTGERIGPAECLALGLASTFVRAEQLTEVVDRLSALPVQAFPAAVDEVLQECARDPGSNSLHELRPLIASIYAAQSFAELIWRLEAEPSGFGARTLVTFAEKSPLSLRVTFEQLRRGAELTFEECLRLEYRIVHRFLACGEFAEGVRALVIDKDRKPRWTYGHWSEVPEQTVEAFLAPLAEGELVFDWQGPEVGSR